METNINLILTNSEPGSIVSYRFNNPEVIGYNMLEILVIEFNTKNPIGAKGIVRLHYPP